MNHFEKLELPSDMQEKINNLKAELEDIDNKIISETDPEMRTQLERRKNDVISELAHIDPAPEDIE